MDTTPSGKTAKPRTFVERATRGFAWNYLYKVTEFGLLNLYTILVVRHFGPQISAPYAVFTALCTMIVLLSAFAVDGVLLRYVQRISANNDSLHEDFTQIEKLNLPRFLKTLFAFRILVVTAVAALIFLILLVLPSFLPSYADTLGTLKKFSLFFVLFLYAQSTIAFCTLSLIGLLETKKVFIGSLFARSALLTCGIIFVLQDSLSLSSAIGLFVASAVINALYLLFIFTNEIRRVTGNPSRKRFPVIPVLHTLRQLVARPGRIKLFLATPIMLYGITTWGSDILSTVLGRQPDILMMRAMLGENSSEIGYYLSASLMLLITEYVFLFGLGGTLVSIFSKLAHDDEQHTERKKYTQLNSARKEVAGFQNVVLLPLCAYMMIFAPQVMRSIYGGKYDAAIPMLQFGLVALALTIGIFAGGMQITTLVAIGKERLVFRNRLFWGIINLGANYFLIRSFGGLGAIIGTQLANAFACGTEYYYSHKFVGGSFDLFGTFRILTISIVSVFGSYLLLQLVGTNGSNYSNSILSAFFMTLTVLSFYHFFRVPEAQKVWNRVRSLFRKPSSIPFVSE
jgi:O-antigen/teichoic acid export membrane protein